MNTLKDHDILYLEDDSPILGEVVNDYETWAKRSPEEKDQLTKMLHDLSVGDDWDEVDTWADVNFSEEEVMAFSAHIHVAGDTGEPEWYKN